MALRGQQKRTFLTYERGILPEDLRLGSLYINPLEPTDGLDSTRYEYRDDIEDQADYETHIRKYTRREELDAKGFSVQFQRSKLKSADISFASFIGLGANRENATTVTLSGTSGRRVKIRRPEAFCEEVFRQDGVERWIRKHASLAYKSKHGKNRWTAPELWLVTGVQYLTGGEFHFEDNSSNKANAHAGADVGAAANLPPGVLKAQAEARRERKNGAQNEFGHEDERVWAAQFMPVKIEFGTAVDDELSTGRTSFPKTIAHFHLEDVPDLTLQGFRASQEQADGERDPPPELIARITGDVESQRVEEANGEGDDEDDSDGGIVIDDGPYVHALQNANWAMYEEGMKYLNTAERARSTAASRKIPGS
ncbi:hypothetical protein N0V90_005841 [Kalmusia sp. IMI 367209]|nr:hypothetical protein N0V90_005841 [Kalmusia sp. IMI 367209]